MIDLQKHKDFLWKYTLFYGNLKLKNDGSGNYAFPFNNLTVEDKSKWEELKTDQLKEQLYACSSLEEIYDFISTEYKDFYFMEISAHLHDDIAFYSTLLKKTFDEVGITEYITKNNYMHLIKFADENTANYISSNIA